MSVVKLLKLSNFSIFRQLQIEEALLRATTENWCLFNDGTTERAIVLGISGKLSELVHVREAKSHGIPLIKRFSGGGTVLVDNNTLFATLIFQSDCTVVAECYPRPIMNWTENFYRPIFDKFGNFTLKENDYTFDHLKFGGNAQAITKQRFLHHTSFLWDYSTDSMNLLKHPKKTPAYREGRDHKEFLCKLGDYLPSREHLWKELPSRLQELGYVIEETRYSDVEHLLDRNYLKNNRLL